LIDHVLKFMTLGTVMIGCIAILTALYTNNRRLGADIFLKYSDRISDLRRRLPTAAFLQGSDIEVVELTPEERRVVHEIIYSIFEVFELKVHGFFPSAIWKIRESDVEALFRLPVFRQEMKVLEVTLAKHPHFLAWVERAMRSSDNLNGAP
jgi:hypothetical protein